MTLELSPRGTARTFTIDVTGLTFDQVQDKVRCMAQRRGWPHWLGRFGFLTRDEIFYAQRSLY